MSSHDGRVAVRSYREVVDQVERRIFRLDRWRLPTPHGVPLRALGYGFATLVLLAIASGLPLLGQLVGLLPESVRLLALPILVGWALAALRVDGRLPHRALIAAVRFLVLPRSWAGLRSCPPVGAELAPLEALEIAPTGDEPRLRAGRVRGPAQLTLRYPATASIRAQRRGGRDDRPTALAKAQQLDLTAAAEPRRPLAKAHVIRLPAGREVRVR